MSKESRRYGYNPDVFEVGRKQAARMLYPHFYAATGNLMRFFEPYIVVSAGAWFGISEDLLHVYCASCCETLESAHDFVELAHSADDLNVFSGEDGICSDYEIWHLVDDEELWEEWESRVADSRRSHRLVVAHLHDCVCTTQRQLVLADGFAMSSMPDIDCRVHDVDWSLMPPEGIVYEIQVFSRSNVVDIYRFPSESDYQLYRVCMSHVLGSCSFIANRYGYDCDGISWSEELAFHHPFSDFLEV